MLIHIDIALFGIICLTGVSFGNHDGGTTDTASEIVILTDANFDETINSAPPKRDWLIMFSSPYCHFCTIMDPEFVEAAKEHPVDRFNVQFAKVNCNSEKTLCSQYNIRGFPSLKFVRDNAAHDCEDMDKKTKIHDYILRVASNPVLPYTPDPMPNEFRSDPYFVLVGNSSVQEQNSPVMTKFTDAARRMMPKFIRSYREHSMNEDVVPVIKRVTIGGNDIIMELQETTTKDDILQFMMDNQRPLVSEIGLMNFMTLVGTKKRWVVMAVDPKNEEYSMALDAVRSAAASGFYPDLLFTWVNSTKFPQWLQHFSVDTENTNKLFVYDPNMERHWPAPSPSAWTSHKAVASFLDDVNADKIQFIGPSKYHLGYALRSLYQNIRSSYQMVVVVLAISMAALVVMSLLVRLRSRKEQDVVAKDKSA